MFSIKRFLAAATPAPAPAAFAAPEPGADRKSGRHFVKDYEAFVDMLLANFPPDEAMSHAVGGAYEETGRKERAILEYAGLKPGMLLIDVGCGSGRLSSALTGVPLDYLGTDVVQKLLDYAKTKSPPNFRFVRHVDLGVPAQAGTVDMICAFSVFTHLQHTESYIYLTDFLRALKPGGVVVFSFLEFGTDHHWYVFEQTVQQERTGTLSHLNIFIERNVIQIWCAHLGFELVELVDGANAPWNGAPLGQCTAILRKPAK